MNERVAPGRSGEAHCPRASRFLLWEDLTPAERETLSRHALGCGVCGPLSDRLTRASAWLSQQLEASLGRSACPESDELFDLGGGPGCNALSELRRAELDEHVSRCAECAGFLTTLQSAPPLPVPLAGIAVEPTDCAALEFPGAAGTRRPARWLAAAAALLIAGTAGFGIWKQLAPGPGSALGPELAAGDTAAGPAAVREPARGSAPQNAPGPEFPVPELPLLRGSSGEPLGFPRGRVLLAEDGAELPWRTDTFEVAPVEGASLYTFVVYQNSGQAFELGPELFRLESSAPRVAAGERWAELGVGHHTWRAWARVHGVEQPLGALDFELVSDPVSVARMRDICARYDAGPQRAAALLSSAHEAGYACDARALARTLPDSAERARFLERQTQR